MQPDPTVEIIYLDPIKEGDGWPGIPSIKWVWDDTPPALLSSVQMTFRDKDGAQGLALYSPSGMTIVNNGSTANTWEVAIGALTSAQNTLTAGTWYADFQFMDADGNGITPYQFVQAVYPTSNPRDGL